MELGQLPWARWEARKVQREARMYKGEEEGLHTPVRGGEGDTDPALDGSQMGRNCLACPVMNLHLVVQILVPLSLCMNLTSYLTPCALCPPLWNGEGTEPSSEGRSED